MPFTHAVPFSSQQLKVLTGWRPLGLEVRITTDDEEFDELAALFRAGARAPAYRITAVSTGEVDVMDADEAVDVFAGLERALAWVERQEALGSVSA